MAILTGPEIARQVELGGIEIDPFRPEHVNPASVDLTLGDRVLVYPEMRVGGFLLAHDTKEKGVPPGIVLCGPDGSIEIAPGHLYLMHTAERVGTDLFVPVLDGKSSIARLGVQVHLTAGFGDPGFRGQYTLEVVTYRAVRLYAGMRICQIRFHEMVGELKLYEGRYRGAAAEGPVPSRVHEQFEE